MIDTVEFVPTPYGEGIIVTEKSGEVSVVFRGPCAREAMEWALSATEDDRRGMLSVLRTAMARD